MVTSGGCFGLQSVDLIHRHHSFPALDQEGLVVVAVWVAYEPFQHLCPVAYRVSFCIEDWNGPLVFQSVVELSVECDWG